MQFRKDFKEDYQLSCCALCPFGSTVQQMARSDDVGTWGDANEHFFLNIVTFCVPFLVNFYCGNCLLSFALPWLCHNVWQGHNMAQL